MLNRLHVINSIIVVARIVHRDWALIVLRMMNEVRLLLILIKWCFFAFLSIRMRKQEMLLFSAFIILRFCTLSLLQLNFDTGV